MTRTRCREDGKPLPVALQEQAPEWEDEPTVPDRRLPADLDAELAMHADAGQGGDGFDEFTFGRRAR